MRPLQISQQSSASISDTIHSRYIVIEYNLTLNGHLARYAKLRVAHAPGMPGWFSPPPQVRDPDMHHGTCVTHVPWCMPGSLICIFLWSWWRGKRSRHSRRMRNPQVYVSGKRSIQYERKRAQICSDYELTKHELWGVFGVLWRNDNAWYPDRTVVHPLTEWHIFIWPRYYVIV